jgi:hypothetical protein
VNLHRRDAHLNDPAGIDHVGGGKFGRGESEIADGLQEASAVFQRGADEDVQVASVSGNAVQRHGVGADDEIFNVVRVQ